MKNKLEFARYIRVRNFEFKNFSTMNHKVLIKLENAYEIESIGDEPIDKIHDENVLATLTWFDINRGEETEIFSEEFEILENEINTFIVNQVLSEEVIEKFHEKRFPIMAQKAREYWAKNS